ncbi:uncharacterized protein OCT59_009134 [Rhizophagus irregularis]|uniref:uncharacterized protein n=1 Tax=Rhizophagus irregularis TaxID=588596 RepID=UPI003331F943|nr:hypothetical protein OCT59_009134 [Rhizophagus irregularis]
MMSSETLVNSLLRDLSRLYNDTNDYDVIIQVGEEFDIEYFKAHSNILKIRSSYFDSALSSNWAKKEGNVFTFKKPNIKPNIFRIILKYIYTGTINIKSVIVENNLIELLIAADEINLDELVDYIQNHIITLDQEWFKRNEIKLYNTLSRYQGVFNILYEHFEDLISNNPDKFLNNFNLFSELEDDALLSLIQNDDKIIGGYNPLSWRGASKYLSTNDSFIFSFQSTLNLSSTVLSRVKNGKNAIYDSAYDKHGFGDGDLRIFDKVCDLKEYEKRIIKNDSFEIEDYEVFQIVKKNT